MTSQIGIVFAVVSGGKRWEPVETVGKRWEKWGRGVKSFKG